MRIRCRTGLHLAVKLRQRDAQRFGVPAHLAQCGEREIAVKRGVFDAFGHDGPGELLELHHELSALARSASESPSGSSSKSTDRMKSKTDAGVSGLRRRACVTARLITS